MSKKQEWGRRSSDNQAYPKHKPEKDSLPSGLIAVDGTRRIRDGETLYPPEESELFIEEDVVEEEEEKASGDDSFFGGGAFSSGSPLGGTQPLSKGRSERPSSSPLGRGSPLSGGSPLGPSKGSPLGLKKVKKVKRRPER